MPLHGCRAKRSGKVLRVHQELPRRLVALVRQVELPRDITDQLAAVRVPGVETRLVGERLRPDAVLFIVRELVVKELALRDPTAPPAPVA